MIRNSYILLSLLATLLVACAPDQPDEPQPSVKGDLAKYAVDFQKAHPEDGLGFRGVVDTNGDVMATYIIYYTSKEPKHLLQEVVRDGDDAYVSNSKKMDDWQRLFCTPQLKEIMAKHSIDFVMGQVLAPGMRDSDPSKLSAQCGP